MISFIPCLEDIQKRYLFKVFMACVKEAIRERGDEEFGRGLSKLVILG